MFNHLIVLCLLVNSAYLYPRLIGSLCKIDDVNVYGRCALIHGCPSVVQDIIHKRNRPTRCGFHGMIEVVCCPTDEEAIDGSSDTDIRLRKGGLRISEKKCMEYNNVPTIISAKSEKASLYFSSARRFCPNINLRLQIAFGKETLPGNYPHMALIGFSADGYYIDWGCGGSLISDQFVLTAAHCYKKTNYGYASYVRLGEYDLSRHDDAYPKDYMISLFIKHPDYNYLRNYNDIALIKVATKVDFNPYTWPACLPTQFETGTHLYATGWGQTDFAGPRSNVLLEVMLHVFNESECQSTYGVSNVLPRGLAHSTQLCAGDRYGHKDTCPGDSGGPLQRSHMKYSCVKVVEGITSYGISCASGGHPGIYTRVYTYIDWIEDTVWR